eukprot:sb/3465951/
MFTIPCHVSGDTALHLATRYGEYELEQVRKGGEGGGGGEEQEKLFRLCAEGDLQMIKHKLNLLDFKTSLITRPRLRSIKLKCHPLCQCEKCDDSVSQSPVSRELLSNTDQYTLLHIASLWGHIVLVNMLLKFGAPPTTQNKDGLLPLHLSQFDEVCEALRRSMGLNPASPSSGDDDFTDCNSHLSTSTTEATNKPSPAITRRGVTTSPLVTNSDNNEIRGNKDGDQTPHVRSKDGDQTPQIRGRDGGGGDHVRRDTEVGEEVVLEEERVEEKAGTREVGEEGDGSLYRGTSPPPQHHVRRDTELGEEADLSADTLEAFTGLVILGEEDEVGSLGREAEDSLGREAEVVVGEEYQDVEEGWVIE